MTEKTNSMRALDARGIHYEVFTFPEDIRSAPAIAEAIGLPVEEVYKTLVVLPSQGHPLLVIVPGDHQLDTKLVARGTRHKKVRMAPHREAEELTGLQVGGISALALLGKSFDVYLDASAEALTHVVVSAGKRGVNLRLAVGDLVDVTGAAMIHAIR